jgi:hypothetical protein
LGTYFYYSGFSFISGGVDNAQAVPLENLTLTDEVATTTAEHAVVSIPEAPALSQEKVEIKKEDNVALTLTDKQEKALEQVGFSADDIKNILTPEKVECFIEKLGIKRVEEIKNGDLPTMLEYIDVRSCL